MSIKKVVFICRGNIFRSQIAKGLYNIMSKDGSKAESYGTSVANDRLGSSNVENTIALYPGMADTIDMMKKEGVDISKEKCKQVTPDTLKDASTIVVMAEKEYIPDWLNNYKYEYWSIPNPIQVDHDFAVMVRDLLKAKISDLIKRMNSNA